MRKRLVSLLLATTLGVTTLTGCASNSNDRIGETKQSPAMERVGTVQQILEPVPFGPYEHVFYKRYDTLTNKNWAEKVYGGQIIIPDGYEILEIENWEERNGYGSQTRGFDVWFINNKPVEATPIYNEAIGDYDCSEPGVVVEKDLDSSIEEESHTLSKRY